MFLHNGGLNGFLCDYSVRVLGNCGYLSVDGQPPGHVSPRLQLKLIATRLQHSAHSPKKKKKTDILELGPDHHLLVVSEQAESPSEMAKSGHSCPLGGTGAGLRAYAWLLPVGCYRHWEQQRLQSRQALVG